MTALQEAVQVGRRYLSRKNVVAGLMFVAVAALGLWLSRNYPVGTAVRMGTGYVPRLLCWVLMLLGAGVLVQGVREVQVEQAAREPDPDRISPWRPVIFVTVSLVAFALTLERLGLVVAIVLLIGFGAVAARGLRLVETLIAALVLIVLAWAVFIWGLGLTIPVWPDW
jgi:putative tricarboxylic transport membrane protein